MTYTTPVLDHFVLAPVDPVSCGGCKFWRVDSDDVGECVSRDFCEMVWSRWEPLSPILTRAEFYCPYHEYADT